MLSANATPTVLESVSGRSQECTFIPSSSYSSSTSSSAAVSTHACATSTATDVRRWQIIEHVRNLYTCRSRYYNSQSFFSLPFEKHQFFSSATSIPLPAPSRALSSLYGVDEDQHIVSGHRRKLSTTAMNTSWCNTNIIFFSPLLACLPWHSLGRETMAFPCVYA